VAKIAARLMEVSRDLLMKWGGNTGDSAKEDQEGGNSDT
jgi:hypothetical protein